MSEDAPRYAVTVPPPPNGGRDPHAWELALAAGDLADRVQELGRLALVWAQAQDDFERAPRADLVLVASTRRAADRALEALQNAADKIRLRPAGRAGRERGGKG